MDMDTSDVESKPSEAFLSQIDAIMKSIPDTPRTPGLTNVTRSSQVTKGIKRRISGYIWDFIHSGYDFKPMLGDNPRYLSIIQHPMKRGEQAEFDLLQNQGFILAVMRRYLKSQYMTSYGEFNIKKPNPNFNADQNESQFAVTYHTAFQKLIDDSKVDYTGVPCETKQIMLHQRHVELMGNDNINHMLYVHRTGSGKNVSMLGFVKTFIKSNANILVVIPTSDLIRQFLEDARKYVPDVHDYLENTFGKGYTARTINHVEKGRFRFLTYDQIFALIENYSPRYIAERALLYQIGGKRMLLENTAVAIDEAHNLFDDRFSEFRAKLQVANKLALFTATPGDYRRYSTLLHIKSDKYITNHVHFFDAHGQNLFAEESYETIPSETGRETGRETLPWDGRSIVEYSNAEAALDRKTLDNAYKQKISERTLTLIEKMDADLKKEGIGRWDRTPRNAAKHMFERVAPTMNICLEAINKHRGARIVIIASYNAGLPYLRDKLLDLKMDIASYNITYDDEGDKLEYSDLLKQNASGLKRFNNRNVSIMLFNPNPLPEGINLRYVDRLYIVVEPDATVDQIMQLKGRANRMCSHSGQLIVGLITSDDGFIKKYQNAVKVAEQKRQQSVCYRCYEDVLGPFTEPMKPFTEPMGDEDLDL